MLLIENLSISYGGIKAVQDVSIEVNVGETVILIGANGAGKSSIINAIMGLVKPTSGQIYFNGTRIDTQPPEVRGKIGIAFSPEGRKLYPSMSIEDNVLSAMQRMSSQEQRQRYAELRKMFPLLEERHDVSAGLLSGGQQQMIAVARAMAARPRLLLLDEPFLGLAPIWIEQISAAIRAAIGEGTTVLMAEQMARPALKLADRGYIIRSGQIQATADVAEFGEAMLAEQYL